MDDPTFDIFRGATERDAIWLEAVSGLSSARQRMEQIAAASPGQFFVFAPESHSIVAQIETRKSALSGSEPEAESA